MLARHRQSPPKYRRTMNLLPTSLLAVAAVLCGACGGEDMATLKDSLPGNRVCFQPEPGAFEQFFQFDETGKVIFGMLDKAGKALRPPGKAATFEVKSLTVTIKEGEATRLVLTFAQAAPDKGGTFTVKDTDGTVKTRTISKVTPASPVGIIRPR